MKPGTMEPIVLIVVVAFGLYAFASMRGALRADGEAAVALRRFAELRGLRAEPGRGPEPVREITWEVVRRHLAPSHAERPSPRGSRRFVGTVDGLSLTVDTPLVRRLLVDVHEPWTRLAIELPGSAQSLRVVLRTRWHTLARLLGRPVRCTGDADFDRVFVQRGDTKGWLSGERRAALVQATHLLGRIEIADGGLFLVRPGLPSEVAELDRLAVGLVELAHALGAADDPA